MISGDDVFVIKLAGGFYQNPKLYGIPSAQGLMLIFSAKTGQPLILLQDEGYLTSLRTAIAGLIVAKYLAPKEVSTVGVLGTGIQARMQVQMLKEWTNCRPLWMRGRDAENVNSYAQDMSAEGFNVFKADSPQEVSKNCKLIIRTTPSTDPLLHYDDILLGTHITAVGADSPNKQELDPKIFSRAQICVVDSKLQCLDHGETFYSVNQGIIAADKLLELGRIVERPEFGRNHEDPTQITIADLTGVAVQDIQIAKSVGRKFLREDTLSTLLKRVKKKHTKCYLF